MSTPSQCLSQIEAVKRAAEDPRSAYLIRTRLKRSLLSTMRMVAANAGSEIPSFPTLAKFTSGDKDNENVRLLCNRILLSTERLCQPSEALDVRWREGWKELSLLLGELEGQILSINSRQRLTKTEST